MEDYQTAGSQTGKENIARLSIIGEFDPSKINVVPTTAKKYNNDTLTQYITTSNDNDEVTLFNTPVVAKLLDDDFFGAVFSDIRDVEGVSTIEFKEWKKLNNYNAKESAPKDNVTYDCVYGGRTRFNVDCPLSHSTPATMVWKGCCYSYVCKPQGYRKLC